MLELERNEHCVAFQKDPEKGYHWNDPSRHLHAYSRQHDVVCVTCFQVNNQGIRIDSLFINSDLRSVFYIIRKKIIVYAFYTDVNIRRF